MEPRKAQFPNSFRWLRLPAIEAGKVGFNRLSINHYRVLSCRDNPGCSHPDRRDPGCRWPGSLLRGRVLMTVSESLLILARFRGRLSVGW